MLRKSSYWNCELKWWRVKLTELRRSVARSSMRYTPFEPKWRSIVRILMQVLLWLAVSIFTLWAFAALCFDVRHDGLRILAAVLFAMAVLGALFAVRGVWLRM